MTGGGISKIAFGSAILADGKGPGFVQHVPRGPLRHMISIVGRDIDWATE